MAKSGMRRNRQTEGEKRAVVAKYIRVSTDRQREEGYSIEIQRERLEGYTRSMFPPSGCDAEFREYVDDGFSGGSLDRPRMLALIEDVKRGEITHVVVVKLDRLSRSQKDTLYLIEDVFLPRGVAFISMGESFNTATAFGRAVVGILSVFAQLERENIFERTRSGMQKRVELGYWPGGGNIPFGYDYDEEAGILVPNRDADTVRRVYDLYLQGHSQQAIADLCGLKYERLVERILTRKTNIGMICYNGMEYRGRHEPLISREVYEKAMAQMAERSAGHYAAASAYLLTGLVFCGKCGAKMRYQKWGRAGVRLVCYSQQHYKPYLVRDPNCDNHRPWAEDIEAVVLDALFGRAGGQIQEEEAPVEPDVLSLLQRQREEQVSRLRRLYSLYAAGDDLLADMIEEAKGELARVDARIRAETERKAVLAAAAETQAKLETLAECWPYMTTAERRSILRSVIERVTVTDDHVHVDFKY